MSYRRSLLLLALLLVGIVIAINLSISRGLSRSEANNQPAATVATRQPGDAASCIKIDQLKWDGSVISGFATNHCAYEIQAVEIDLQLVDGSYIAQSVTTFGSHVPPDGYFMFDEHTRGSSDHDLKPFVAAVRET